MKKSDKIAIMDVLVSDYEALAYLRTLESKQESPNYNYIDYKENKIKKAYAILFFETVCWDDYDDFTFLGKSVSKSDFIKKAKESTIVMPFGGTLVGFITKEKKLLIAYEKQTKI